MRRTDFSIFSRIMVQTGFAAGYATAFLWGIFGLYDGSVTFGMMTAFLQLVAQVQRPMVELSRQIPAFIQVFTATERLEELSSLSPEEQGEAVRLPGRLGICLKDVDYSYPGSSRKVLQGFSHDFLPGKSFQQLPFRFFIQGRSRFIQQEDASGAEQAAGNCNPLCLAFTESCPLFTAKRIQSFR